MIEKIDIRQTMESKAYSILKNSILHGILKPGEKLNQEKLAQQLNVSRIPIRIAINRLEKDGLVQSIPYKGTRVTIFSKSDVEDIYSIRLLLEIHALKLSIDYINEDELKKLYSIHEEMKRSFREDPLSNIGILNKNFHMNLYKMCGHRRLIKMINDTWNSLPLNFFWNFSKEAKKSLVEHGQILEFAKKREKEKACKILKVHLNRSKIELLKKFTTDSCI